MKMKGQIESVYPPAKEPKKKKDKKVAKKAAKEKSKKKDKKARKSTKDALQIKAAATDAKTSTSPSKTISYAKKPLELEQEALVQDEITQKLDQATLDAKAITPPQTKAKPSTPARIARTKTTSSPSTIKPNARSATQSKATVPPNEKGPMVRASKNSQALMADDKKKTMQTITKQLMLGEISQGEALKTLRIQVLGLKQEDFANLTGVSRKTLSENENDKGNYTADIVNKLFYPFNLKVGLVPF